MNKHAHIGECSHFHTSYYKQLQSEVHTDWRTA